MPQADNSQSGQFLTLPHVNGPWIDTKTGLPTTEFFIFLRGILQRTGAQAAPSSGGSFGILGLTNEVNNLSTQVAISLSNSEISLFDDVPDSEVFNSSTGSVNASLGFAIDVLEGEDTPPTSTGGTVTEIDTAGAGISGGPITSTGTLTVEWNAGTVAAIKAADLVESSTTLQFATRGTLSLMGNPGTTSVSPTDIPWGPEFGINSGTLHTDLAGTIAVSGTTTTITPAHGTELWVINMDGTHATTITVGNGLYDGQRQRVRVVQGSTPEASSFDSTVEFGTGTTAWAYTNTASKTDIGLLEWNSAKSIWMFLAEAPGF